jgi:hypothetical protein
MSQFLLLSSGACHCDWACGAGGPGAIGPRLEVMEGWPRFGFGNVIVEGGGSPRDSTRGSMVYEALAGSEETDRPLSLGENRAEEEE